VSAHTTWREILVIAIYSLLPALGAFICALNFYLTFLRRPLYRLRGREAEYRNVSGFPLIGSFLLLFGMFSSYANVHFGGPKGHLDIHMPFWARIGGLVLAALDTGGLHWFIASQIWYYRKKGGDRGDKA
jgi:hypothetical protein